MGTKSPGGPQRCRLILKQCIAVQLSKPGHTLDDFWMYDSGYMVFQVSFYFCIFFFSFTFHLYYKQYIHTYMCIQSNKHL